MTFSIYQMDELDSPTEESERALLDYVDAVVEQFQASPEGHARAKQGPGLGGWSGNLVQMGYTYAGVTLPRMSIGDIDEIVNELFPRKVTLTDPDDVDDVIPELTAFWQFLRREYQLENADAVLEFLRKVEPEFKERMNDPANFGMAKSFVTAGQNAGYDMTTPEGMEAFRRYYNANLSQPGAGGLGLSAPEGLSHLMPDRSTTPTSARDKSKRKRLRQQAKRARRKNRKR